MTTSTPAGNLSFRHIIGDYSLTYQNMLLSSFAALIASTYTSTQPLERYDWLRSNPAMRKFTGERSSTAHGGDTVTILNDTYEGTIEFKLDDLTMDKSGQCRDRIADLAREVAVFPEELLTTLLTTNGTAYDGVAFFSGSHAVGGQSIDNDVVAGDGLAGGTTPTTAQMANNLLIVLTRMLGFKNDKGRPMNEAAREFMVMTSPELFAATVAAIDSMFTSASASNPLQALRGRGFTLVPHLNARLTTGNQFYMFRMDAGIKSLLLQTQSMRPVVLDENSEHCKKTRKVMFGHDWRGGVGYGRFELAARGTTS